MTTEAQPAKQTKLLIVEDDVMIRVVLADMLCPFAVRGPRIDAEGELSSRCAHVSGSGSADTSSLASFKTASRTCQLTAAISACWSISSRTCCQCGRSSRSLPIAAIYSQACKIVRSVPPSFVGMGWVSFFERYAGRNMA